MSALHIASSRACVGTALRSVRKHLLGVSLLALAAGCATAAHADCAGTNPTTCTGTTVGRAWIGSDGTIVVADGATLTAGPGDTEALTVTSGSGSSTNATITVNGTVSGSQSGIAGYSSATNYGFSSAYLDIRVGVSGRVEGQSAILLNPFTGTGFSYVTATLDNSGVVDGTAYGLFTTNSGSVFTSVNNRAGGVIRGASGAILVPVNTLVNDGLIDGGTGSAYSFYQGSPGTVTNTGTMTSGSQLGTIYLPGGYGSITNSGLIENSNGPAISSFLYLTLTNSSGGVIKSTSPNFAIQTQNGGAIVNEGTIIGNIDLGSNPGETSFLTNSKGVIDGSVFLGSGNDVLNVSWDAAGDRIAGISGTVDGGGGTNTLQFAIAQDVTLDDMLTHVVKPTNFQLMGVVVDAGATATVNVDAPDGLLIGGGGNFITTGQTDSTGLAFGQTLVPPYDMTTMPGFTNTGNIRAFFAPPGGVVQSDDYGLLFSNLRSFSNTGTITVMSGNGVYAQLGSYLGPSADTTFSNTGSITAGGTALTLMPNGGTATNEGDITSTGGTGLLLYGTGTMTNTGRIAGKTQGVSLFTSMSNSGTITATDGPGVFINYGRFENLAGGVVGGSGDAIASGFGATVSNAGTISGNVDFAVYPYAFYGSTFIDKGGQINGDLIFGSGYDTYVTDISKYANGRFTNISGTITGGDGADTLVLQVQADASGKVTSIPTFEHTEYDLSNDAKLTLSSDAIIDRTLTLAGTGSVDLTVDFNVKNSQGLVVATPFGASYTDPGALTIVSHGNMTFSRGDYWSYTGVYLRDTSSFENAGTISISSDYLQSPPVAAVNSGKLVTNSGAINAYNAAAVYNALKVVNSGTIEASGDTQTNTAFYGAALSGVNNVENSGSITSQGTAVQLNYYSYNIVPPAQSVTNSGLIRSTDGNAITQYSYWTGATITNTASGSIISDKGYAILAGGYGADIRNAGTITGDIQTFYGDDRIENSGTLTGAVNLGDGNDTLRLTGGSFTGSADGGWGNDRLELAVTGNTPLALGTTAFTGFEVLDMQSGTASTAGDNSFGTIQVSGGRLIGLAGSHLSAQTITVAPGATFGSAGTVTGNITVGGTLSPGASPGTMTVVGNVSLATGSTSLFELTPTVNDKLVVQGTLTIANGATLQLSGTPKLIPGQKLDLITASGGINGAFSTISGTPGNLHILQSGNSLQGLGLFSASTANAQVSGTIGTLNAALIGDKVSPTLLAAMSSLVDASTGDSDPQALLRLSPQAYASAPQLAVEDALAVVDAAREESHFAAGTPGGFAFGQAIGGSRKLTGDASTGVDSAKISVSGALGGFGYGARSAWVGAFVGHLNGSEHLRGLDARTATTSFVAGAQGQVQAGGFRLGGMAAYDRADARTRRLAPGGATANGRFALKSWIANLDVSYRARLNADWTVEPRLSATSVRTTRDGVTETGGGVFALSVAGARSTQTFVDGRIAFEGGQQTGQALHPFASIGFVSRTGGDTGTASASLAGLGVLLTADGLDRDGTRAAVEAGVRYDLSGTLKASAGYSGEFGNNGRQALRVGLHWAF